MNINRLTDTDMEKCVLGSIFIDGELIFTCPLRVSDFYNTKHKKIYETMLELKTKNIPVDIASVWEELKKKKLDDKITLSELNMIADTTPTALNFETYVEKVRDKSIKRKLWKTINRIKKRIEDDEELSVVMDEVQKIFDIEFPDDKTARADEVLSEVWDDITTRQDKVFLPTGIDGLDQLIGGFTRQSFNIIASRPSIGKSTVALQIALGQRGAKKVLLFSLEMDKRALIRRMLSHVSEIPHRRIQFNTLTDEDLAKLSKSLALITNSQIYINDETNLSVSDIERIATKYKKTTGLDFVIIDYLQLLKAPKREKRVDEVSSITRELKLMARRLDVAVVSLSQLNRESEKRVDKRPSLSELRESGSIEQDADVVILIWRKPNGKGLPTNEGEFIVAKNRDGRIGNVPFVFHNEYLKFETLVGGEF